MFCIYYSRPNIDGNWYEVYFLKFSPVIICLILLSSKRWASIQWLNFCHNNKETSSKRYGKLTEVCICSKALPHYSMSAQIMSRFMMFYKQSPMLRVFCIWHEQCRLFVPISVESGLSMNKKKIIFKVLCLLHYVLTATCIFTLTDFRLKCVIIITSESEIHWKSCYCGYGKW